jgi:multiple sugar transport system permease protein
MKTFNRPSGPSPALWLFAAPALALMTLSSVVPIAQTVALASGYKRVPLDRALWSVLRNTLVFTGWTVSLELILGLAMALLLMKPFRGRGFVRAAVLIPWALPSAVMAMAWRWIFNAEYGIFSDILYRLHLSAQPQVAWLAQPKTALFACIFADVWKTTPFMAILLMSGLSTIPEDLYEAASIDGAGPVRRFFTITLPLLKPTIALAVLFRAIQAFGIFDLIYVMTGGGPGGRTRMIALYIYDTVFRYQELAYGCTLSLVMAAALLLLSAAIFAVLRPNKS